MLHYVRAGVFQVSACKYCIMVCFIFSAPRAEGLEVLRAAFVSCIENSKLKDV